MYSKGRDIWAGVPRFKAKIRTKGRKNGEIEIVGTLRAAGCRYFTSRRSGFDDNTCAQCAGLLHDKSFKKALLQSVKDSGGPVDMEMVDDYSMDTHNSKLRRDQLEHKAALIAAELHEATTELRHSKVALQRSHANVQELKGQATEERDERDVLKVLSAELQKLKPNTGSPIEICAMLLDAHAAGKFSTDASGSNAYDTFLSVLSDSMYNLDKKHRGGVTATRPRTSTRR